MPVEHYENFPVASLVMPRRLRPAVVAIYCFARTADDIADEDPGPPAERLAKLAALRSGVARLAAGEVPADPVLGPLALAVHRHDLPIEPFHRLLDAFAQDVVRSRYETFGELRHYCARSADPIGRLLLALYGHREPESLAESDSVCTGLQLTNFWQDVAIDWAKGRVYLPQEDLARFGVAEEQIAAGRCDARWRALLAFQVARARHLLDAGWPLARRLGGRLGLELRLVIAGGARILDRIDAAGGDVFRRRPTLARRDWLPVLARALGVTGP